MSLVRKIQKIQSLDQSIDLPMVVAIGPQSSGKSSVIEQIIRLDILPAGIDMVTRCPVIINMVNSSTDEFVKIEGIDKRFNFNELDKVKKEIAFLMDQNVRFDLKKECHTPNTLKRGARRFYSNISSIEIRLTVHMKDSYNLILVDLPGLVKIPLDVQPKDIKERIEDLVMKYIKRENVIILSVINASVDMSNAEALALSLKVDPRGERTLGVVTKVDLMDKGTTCLDVLRNKIVSLNYGYVALVNRGILAMKKTLLEAEESERQFFKDSAYNILVNKGSEFLRNHLEKIFYEKIKLEIPSLVKEMKERKTILEDQCQMDRKYNPYMVVNKFVDMYRCTLEDCYVKKTKDSIFYLKNTFLKENNNFIKIPDCDKTESLKFMESKNEKSRSRENIWNTSYKTKQSHPTYALINSAQMKEKKEIEPIVEKNTDGIYFLKIRDFLSFEEDENIEVEYYPDRNALFISDALFKFNVSRMISNFKEKILSRTQNLSNLLLDNFNQIGTFWNTKLLDILSREGEYCMKNQINIWKTALENYCDVEMVINLEHPDLDKKAILERTLEKDDIRSWSRFFTKSITQEPVEKKVLRSYCTEYFKIIKKNIVNYFYKSYVFYILNFIETELKEQLVPRISKTKLEDENREERKRELERINEILNILEEET